MLFSGPPPRGGLQFFHVSAFGFMCVVVHVRCCLPCQVARAGVGGKMLKTLVHRSFINSNYSSITTQKLFTKET